jgi:hypothetical protein
MAAKRRPSFTPASTKTGAAPASTDWVYRSDAAAKASKAPAAPPPAPARRRASTPPAAKTLPPAGPRATPARRRPALGSAAALLAPVALVHLMIVAPLVACIRGWWART